MAIQSPFCSLGILKVHFLLPLVHYYISQDLLQLKYHVTKLDHWTVWAEVMGMTSRTTPTKPHLMALPSHSCCVSWMQRI